MKMMIKWIMALGAAALAYFQQTSCRISENDIVEMQKYWENKVLNLEREIQVRADFLKKINSIIFWRKIFILIPELICIPAGDEYLSELKKSVAIFKKSTEELAEELESLMAIYCCLNNPRIAKAKTEFSAVIKNKKTSLKKLLAPVFTHFDLAMESISKYDSNMMCLIKGETDEIAATKLTKDYVIFKYTEENKITAINVIYTLYLMDINKRRKIFRIVHCDFSKLDIAIKHAVFYLSTVAIPHISCINITNFMNEVKKKLMKPEFEESLIIEVINEAFPLLFYNTVSLEDTHEPDKEIHLIYSGLLKKNIPESEMDTYKDMPENKIVKLITIECLMHGGLMDYRRNHLLSRLGGILESMFDPDPDKKGNPKDIHEKMRTSRIAQERVLGFLSMLWKNQDTSGLSNIQIVFMKHYHAINEVDYFDFRYIQESIMSAKWMYGVASYMHEFEPAEDEDEVSMGMHFDLSYTHPMWYICQKCEHINHLKEAHLKPSTRPFMEISNGIITLRPDRINKTENNLARAMRMQSCIEAFFFPSVEIIIQKEEEEHLSVLSDFVICLANREEKTVKVYEEE
ncbi:hypothetical protein NEMIN01_0662 [Nematocida minor]|uniref:uncharacterized protein n=1 Tax=Nematocida minor TaxID=1912983 RepID=UPI00221FA99F|nr:uncharacterized protein NEMIN01_0662 [Nematocida minor]KAI5189709.1 hypothetical protein NEMIN01_0662 [Nematocida minor]